MKLFGWFSNRKQDGALERWREAWSAAIDGHAGSDAELKTRLDALAATEPDVELEREMLDALEALRAIQGAVANGGPPVIQTHHRVIGAEACHFTAPASIPTDQAQAAGRVLMTTNRAVFVGGGRTTATPWHQVHEVARLQRDVLFARPDRTPVAHFRFNTYADAVVCAFLARHLKPARRARL
jgi:hypothetical protein